MPESTHKDKTQFFVKEELDFDESFIDVQFRISRPK